MNRSFLLVLLLSLGIVAADYRLNKRLQWNTFVVCPGGEIAFGQGCKESVEKKALSRKLDFLENYTRRFLKS